MPVMSRRTFLTASGVTAGAALAAGATTHPWTALVDAGRRDPLPPGSGILVLVTLYGGNDGLNTAIPYRDKAYHDARPELAYTDSEVLRLRNGEDLALNPGLKGFKTLFDQGRLAIVRGVGYPRPDRSHFRSMAIWQTASPETAVPSGWLGRWLDATGTDPLRAVAVGPTVPPLLAGTKTAGSAVPVGPFVLPSGRLGAAFADLESPYAGDSPLAARVAQSGEDLLAVAAKLGSAVSAAGSSRGAKAAATATSDASTDLAAQLDVVARCVQAAAPTRVYAVSLGGFDTHADEKGTQARLLGELDTAVTGFLTELGSGSRAEDVVVAVYSEFGRRVAANASQGTDHGTAAPMFLLGGKVKGGMYGDQPGISSGELDSGDLRFTTDFRAVYATLLEGVLGFDAGEVLGGGRYARLPVF